MNNDYIGMEMEKFRDIMAENNYNTVFRDYKGICEVYDGKELVMTYNVELLCGSWYIRKVIAA